MDKGTEPSKSARKEKRWHRGPAKPCSSSRSSSFHLLRSWSRQTRGGSVFGRLKAQPMITKSSNPRTPGRGKLSLTPKLDEPMKEQDVETLFRLILRRPVGSEPYKKNIVTRNMTARQMIVALRNCEELRLQINRETQLRDISLKQAPTKEFRDPRFHRVPQHLSVTNVPIKRVLIIGSCLAEHWRVFIPATWPGCRTWSYFAGVELPKVPEQPVSHYDFQMLQLPLRGVLPDASFARLNQMDIEGHERLFEAALNKARVLLDRAMAWNKAHGILTFVFSFVVPQQNLVAG